MTTEITKIERIDLYRERPAFFRASRNPELVDLPEANYLVVNGEGPPESAAFRDAVGALYSVAYTLKMSGKQRGRDFRVPTFEGAWWIYSDQGELPRSAWRWRLLMMVPDFITGEDVSEAKRELTARKRSPKSDVGFEQSSHGLCVQVLHVGPYATENESIDRMHRFMAERGLIPRGPHQEVYLGDPRRSRPEALKTILRQAVEPA